MAAAAQPSAAAAGTPSPPKPWEAAGAQPGAAPGTAGDIYSPTSAAGYGVPSGGAPGYPYGSQQPPYSSAYQPSSLYGSSPYSSVSAYGSSSPYGSPYSSYGGMGAYSSPYSSYGGGLGSYGGGLGSYGGYGAGAYGGYGSAYGGGYGSRYGGGGFGGLGGPPMMGPGPPGMEWLGGLHQTSTSIGQITEILGVNADALQYALGSTGHLIERMGAVAVDLFSFLMGTPPIPMVDPRTGQPVIDPRTGQPFPMLTPEQYRKERRLRIFRWIVGLLVCYLGYRVVKYMLSPSKPLDASMNAAFQDNLSRINVAAAQTASWPPTGPASLPAPLGASSSNSSGFAAGLGALSRPDLDAAFNKKL